MVILGARMKMMEMIDKNNASHNHYFSQGGDALPSVGEGFTIVKAFLAGEQEGKETNGEAAGNVIKPSEGSQVCTGGNVEVRASLADPIDTLPNHRMTHPAFVHFCCPLHRTSGMRTRMVTALT
jgi:hypothetical protein